MKGVTWQCLQINFCNENNLAMYLVHDKNSTLTIKKNIK